LFLALVLFNVSAERTMTQLHISELILILDEETAAVFTASNCHIGNHVLEVSLG